MHEMGNQSWYTTVTLRLKGKIISSYQSKEPSYYKQRSLTNVTSNNGRKVMLIDIARMTWP
jgi:hypothetical protein